MFPRTGGISHISQILPLAFRLYQSSCSQPLEAPERQDFSSLKPKLRRQQIFANLPCVRELSNTSRHIMLTYKDLS